MAELALRNLIKYYGTVQAVRGVSLSAPSGELLCILGPSGCGKSTTLRMIGGFEHVDGGEITIDGKSIVALPPNRRPTGMVFQKYTLWPHLRVRDNVAFGLKLRRMTHSEIERRVRGALEMVGLPDTAQRYPHQLSGGEQQRIALARSLVLEPHVLLLDEPLSNLDARLRVRMREEIKRIQRATGITTIFVTHDQEEALSIADRIAVMHGGILEQIDTPATLYARPRSRFVADFVGVMNSLEGRLDREQGVIAVASTVLPAGGARSAAVQDLRVAIRPEDLHVRDEGGRGIFTGTVEVVMDLGHFRQIQVQMPEQVRLTVFVPKDQLLHRGQTVHLEASRFLVFTAETDPYEVVPSALAE